MHKTDWFYQSKYGVMLHFLPQPWEETERKYPFHRQTELMAPSEWNRLVEKFDVPAVVNQLRETKAGYLLLSLGQTSGYYLAPNRAYDKFGGFAAGDRCAIRDLPSELHSHLDQHGIKLMLYLPIEPAAEMAKKLGLTHDPSAKSQFLPEAFVKKWCSIIQWWSDHYGQSLSGWWFDGRSGNCAQTKQFVEAATHGNQGCITNLGELGDYEGGHCAIAHRRISDPEWFGRLDWEVQRGRMPDGRFTHEGLQWHALLHFGEHWWDRDGFYDTNTEIMYTQEVIRNGGVVTWDCGPNIGRSEGPVGTISEIQMSKLLRIHDAVGKKSPAAANTNPRHNIR